MNRFSDSVPRKDKEAPRPESASPRQLVGMAYDLAILACHRSEAGQSQKAIGLLRDVMRALGPEDSADLLASYDWCLERIWEGDFPLAAQMLADLRAAWEQAERSLSG